MARNRNPEETRDKILDATLHLFKEKGYEKTTILEIVERLEGLTRGAFYHHFKSKEEVLYALLARNVDQDMQLEILKSPNLSGLEKIRRLLIGQGASVKFMEDDATISHIYFDLLKDPRFLAEHMKANRGVNVHWLKGLVVEAMADGSIKKRDPQMLSELILLLLNVWMNPTIYDPIDFETFERKVLDIKEILDGLGCPIIDEDAVEILKEMALRYDETEL